jgi:hypothetical protein
MKIRQPSIINKHDEEEIEEQHTSWSVPQSDLVGRVMEAGAGADTIGPEAGKASTVASVAPVSSMP